MDVKLLICKPLEVNAETLNPHENAEWDEQGDISEMAGDIANHHKSGGQMRQVMRNWHEM